MDEFVCLTILANPSETESAFKSRLVAFWTHMLRNRPDDYEKVYAEEVEFEEAEGRIARRYMIEPELIDTIQGVLTQESIAFLPIDPDDLYSKAEASSREWFQIEH